MSQRGPRVSTSRQESRISRLEKRDADHGSDLSENGAPITGAIHIERPHDLRKVIEDAVVLARKDPHSTGVAKGRALAYIAGKAAQILPLLEMEDQQEEDWEKLRKEQDEFHEIVTSDPRAYLAAKTLLEITYQRSATTGKPMTITRELEEMKAELVDALVSSAPSNTSTLRIDTSSNAEP
jgi:hypothetical protein